ncbi:hypothetical protein LZ518_11345 [Sphingomonas sp. RB56-2]|uniref:Adenylate cyclase n=1 Tax=Sphingomonas brevis TaxID=2908206 RepID=A0ABT0SBD4_9SPHN|nr:hypothetical protein [Sphingomonas brevis]MCL6741721.1 hypothetical protein [Sphingomonas brevis]
MNKLTYLFAAGAIALSPGTLLAAPGGSQGPTNGTGWDHFNGPDHPTGQPGAECEDVRPGQASSAPGSAFNPDGNAGTHYAGEQPQNSRNSSSVSQYDVACLNQENNHTPE